MGVLDSYTTIGEEAVAYGTLAAALTRGLEVDTDPGKRQLEHLKWDGMRPGFETTRANRRRPVVMGAGGDLNLPLMNSGLGLLFKAMFGAPTITAGTPTKMEFTTTPAGSTTSLTVQQARGRHVGGVLASNYLGGMVASWEVGQKIGGEDALAMLKVTMDYQREVSGATAATAVYPEPTWMYGWPDCLVTVGGAGCAFDLTLTGDHAIRTDRRCLSGTGLKEKPYRNGVPKYAGTFSTDYGDDTLNDLARLGTTTPVVVKWEMPGGDLVRFTYAAVMIDGDTPVVTLGGSTQSVPWTALDNGTDPVLKVEYWTPDLAV